jgi:hypothetical protein
MKPDMILTKVKFQKIMVLRNYTLMLRQEIPRVAIPVGAGKLIQFFILEINDTGWLLKEHMFG